MVEYPIYPGFNSKCMQQLRALSLSGLISYNHNLSGLVWSLDTLPGKRLIIVILECKQMKISIFNNVSRRLPHKGDASYAHL